MSEEASVILDLSPEVRTLLEQQGVDLYEEIQRELPSAKRAVQSDPQAPQGSRDVVTVIAVAATLVTALTPIILRILNMITPPDSDQTWTIEETETRHPDGSATIHRMRVHSKHEQRPYQQTDQSRGAEIDQSKATGAAPPSEGKDAGE